MPQEAVKLAILQVMAISDDSKGYNENQTCNWLIDPILEALGWDVKDTEQVVMQYFNHPNGKRVDYVFLDNVGNPAMVLEAKAFGLSLTGRPVIEQIRNSARLLSKGYAISCNGKIWRIYDVSKKTKRAGFLGKLVEEIDLRGGVNSNAAKLNRFLRRRRRQP